MIIEHFLKWKPWLIKICYKWWWWWLWWWWWCCWCCWWWWFCVSENGDCPVRCVTLPEGKQCVLRAGCSVFRASANRILNDFNCNWMMLDSNLTGITINRVVSCTESTKFCACDGTQFSSMPHDSMLEVRNSSTGKSNQEASMGMLVMPQLIWIYIDQTLESTYTTISGGQQHSYILYFDLPAFSGIVAGPGVWRSLKLKTHVCTDRLFKRHIGSPVPWSGSCRSSLLSSSSTRAPTSTSLENPMQDETLPDLSPVPSWRCWSLTVCLQQWA